MREQLASSSHRTQQAAGTDGYQKVLDEAFTDEIGKLVDDAEASGRFPRQLIELLGSRNVFEAKWRDSPIPDLGCLIALGERLGGLGCLGLAIGVSLHDAAIAILRRFGRNGHLSDIADAAIAGRLVLCIGASEHSGGSDLANAASTAVPTRGGYQLTGSKKFVSLAPVADVVLLVARIADDASDRAAEDGLGVFAVPLADVSVGRQYRTVGTRCLSTAPVDFDVWVPAEAAVGPPGGGLAVVSWGLAHERLSVASQVVGLCDVALGITLARMKQREQFGERLIDHQALRLRVADLAARLDVLRWALQGIAHGERLDIRTAAGFKVTAVRFGNELLSECMHIFGGTGYLLDQSPMGRWFVDMKLGRVGGGTDEVLWELVAAGLKPDFDRYSQLVDEAPPEMP